MALGAWLVIEQHATGGVMLATTVILGKALMPIEQIIGGWKQLAEIRNAWRRLGLGMQTAQVPTHTQLPAPTGHLRAEQVCLSDPANGKLILADIDFHLAAGESLAIIGASASGKSTLARLLTGLWKPDAGVVRLDGADIAQWPRDSLGPYLGYVPQDVELFAGTVAENIARTHRHAGNALLDATAIVRAARRAQAHELILRLPQGYETEIGENGHGLSGGQRQRIALARALYGDPVLLILDEPNANLDANGELQLQSALRQLKEDGVTIIFITHRTPLIQLADKVLILRDGRIDCFGSRADVENWIEARQGQAGTAKRRVAQ